MKPLTFASRPGVLGLALAALLTAVPVAADWLVTREGGRVETKGPWAVKGKLVVFKTADGKLSSLRLADVDLDASRRVTEEAVAAEAQAAAEPSKPAERKKSVRVITDKDVRPAAPPAAAATQPTAGETGEAAAAAGPTTGPGVVVGSWSQSKHPKDNSVVIDGTLQNASSATAADLKLKVLIFDESGSLMATSQAALAATALSPGQKIAFRAEFPGYFSFATIKFEAESRPLSTRQPDQPIPPPPAEDGTENGG
jgi:hypothetical protein